MLKSYVMNAIVSGVIGWIYYGKIVFVNLISLFSLIFSVVLPQPVKHNTSNNKIIFFFILSPR